MTTEEKLQNFYTASIESAQKDAQALLDEHKAALDKICLLYTSLRGRRQSGNVCCRTPEKKKESGRRLSKVFC